MFTDMYAPHISGVTTYIRLFKRRFEELGHEVFVFTFGNTEHLDDEPNIVRSAGLPIGNTGFNFSLMYSAEARAIIPTLDVAHVHHPFQSGRLVQQHTKDHNLPLVFTNHTRYDIYSDTYAEFVPKRPRYAALKWELGRFLDNCSVVVTPSPSIVRWLDEFIGYEGAIVMPAGINLHSFAHPATTKTRAELGISEDDLVYCYIGRVELEKNMEYLFSEFRLVADAIPNARLLVVGGGNACDALTEEALCHPHSDRMIFVGSVPYDEVPAYAHLGDVFVTGSTSETLGLVVLEAMAAGLPIVAVDSPGIGESVIHGECGLLAPTAEPGLLAHGMVHLALDSELRARLAAGATERARAFSLDVAADRMLALYAALISESRTE